jgi:hypothetical protein
LDRSLIFFVCLFVCYFPRFHRSLLFFLQAAAPDDPESVWPLIPLRLIGRRGSPAGGHGAAADPFSMAVYNAVGRGVSWQELADGLSKWGAQNGVTPYIATGGSWVDAAGGFR